MLPCQGKKQLDKACKENVLELLLHSPLRRFAALWRGSLRSAKQHGGSQQRLFTCLVKEGSARARPKRLQGNHNPARRAWGIHTENLTGGCLVFLTEVLHLIANVYIWDQSNALGKIGIRPVGTLERPRPQTR